MNRNRKLAGKMFDLQLFTGGTTAGGGTAITRDGAEALIPVQESHDIIQGVVEQSAVRQRGRRLANMTAAQYRMPVLDLLPVAYFVNGEGVASRSSPEQEELLQLRDAVIYDALYGRQYITAAMNEPAEKAA